MLALVRKIFDLKATSGSLVGSFQIVKTRVVVTERDLKKDQKTTAMSVLH